MVIAIAIAGSGADWWRRAVFSLRVRAAMAGCTGCGARLGSVVVCAVGVASGDGRTGEPDVGVCDNGEREAGDDGAFHTTEGEGRRARGVPGAGVGIAVGLDGVMGVVGVIGLGVRGVRGDGNVTGLAFAAAAAAACVWRYGRADAGEVGFARVVVTATGDMAGKRGEVGVSGLSSGAERWRRGLLRNALRAASDVGEDGDAVVDSGLDRAGEVGAVEPLECDAECVDWDEFTDSPSTLTTSQPSASEAEDESDDDMKLTFGCSLALRPVTGKDCERECSRSLPLRDPNKRFTPKLSRRLMDFVLDGTEVALFSVVTVLAHALGILKNDVLVLGDMGDVGGLDGSGLCDLNINCDRDLDMKVALEWDGAGCSGRREPQCEHRRVWLSTGVPELPPARAQQTCETAGTVKRVVTTRMTGAGLAAEETVGEDMGIEETAGEDVGIDETAVGASRKACAGDSKVVVEGDVRRYGAAAGERSRGSGAGMSYIGDRSRRWGANSSKANGDRSLSQSSSAREGTGRDDEIEEWTPETPRGTRTTCQWTPRRTAREPEGGMASETGVSASAAAPGSAWAAPVRPVTKPQTRPDAAGKDAPSTMGSYRLEDVLGEGAVGLDIACFRVRMWAGAGWSLREEEGGTAVVKRGSSSSSNLSLSLSLLAGGFFFFVGKGRPGHRRGRRAAVGGDERTLLAVTRTYGDEQESTNVVVPEIVCHPRPLPRPRSSWWSRKPTALQYTRTDASIRMDMLECTEVWKKALPIESLGRIFLASDMTSNCQGRSERGFRRGVIPLDTDAPFIQLIEGEGKKYSGVVGWKVGERREQEGPG
ncbi:hypothetical protein L226DRAFT_524626 [Lentinus tigrinus ALCF2SS1-7]|uniref:Uncharacterized protein n=1 Tax=Lentinus tigrinus ALCF2SS1-6 TaxID=1328759 RepID=A0A5C2RVH1_9APHY|nr:hypothetical protein L227DRAFT_566561 [Lentinus tigrinus ALCF2SS1-6]RPD72585.1 hypothetical protein L226DRAFT_524626 [Lentinus tigrinus ALCF2SS1-7]